MDKLDPFFISYFIALVLGLYMLISAVILVARASYYRKLIENMRDDSPGLMIGSSITLALGLVLVMLHNHWEWSSFVVVTIVCWMILIKAILWLLFPECMLSSVKKVYKGKAFYFVAAFFALLGVFLILKVTHLYVGI